MKFMQLYQIIGVCIFFFLIKNLWNNYIFVNTLLSEKICPHRFVLDTFNSFFLFIVIARYKIYHAKRLAPLNAHQHCWMVIHYNLHGLRHVMRNHQNWIEFQAGMFLVNSCYNYHFLCKVNWVKCSTWVIIMVLERISCNRSWWAESSATVILAIWNLITFI